MKLTDSPIGKRVKIVDVAVDRKTKNRLQNIGIITGCDVVLIKNNLGDAVIKVRDCSVAMNKEVANGIIVEEDV